jgi:hypothetical protein
MAVVRGTVRRRGGGAIAGARVYWVNTPDPHRDVAAVTNEQGRFALDAGRAGTYRLGVRADQLPPREIDLMVTEGGAADVEIELGA